MDRPSWHIPVALTTELSVLLSKLVVRLCCTAKTPVLLAICHKTPHMTIIPSRTPIRSIESFGLLAYKHGICDDYIIHTAGIEAKNLERQSVWILNGSILFILSFFCIVDYAFIFKAFSGSTYVFLIAWAKLWSNQRAVIVFSQGLM